MSDFNPKTKIDYATVERAKVTFTIKPRPKSEIKKVKAFIKKFRKTIPKRYNQIYLVDELCNDELDHYVSISNRTDGKSFNYIDFFAEFSIEFDIGFFIVVRHFTLRWAYTGFLFKVFREKKGLNPEDLTFKRFDHYIQVIYQKKSIGIISDLNTATDLKLYSNFLEDYPILIYDEFLAIEDDYLMGEWERLATIYTSVDRKDSIPYINYPRIFYLGNAVNFSSPILANMDIFDKLETQEINTQRIYENKVLEMRRNDNANASRNSRAFGDANDAMKTGQFKVNNFLIANENQLRIFKTDIHFFTVNLGSYLLLVKYKLDSNKILLSIIPDSQGYEFNVRLKDTIEGSEYIRDIYYQEEHFEYYLDKYYLFKNSYSRDVILENQQFTNLNIMSLIDQHRSTYNVLDNELYNEVLTTEQKRIVVQLQLIERFENGLMK